MEQTAALRNLLDTADLLAMLDELLTHSSGRVSAAALSGIKVSIKNARENVLSSHDALAQGVIQKPRQAPEAVAARPQTVAATTPNGAPAFDRKDLRASLERMIESK